MTDREFIQSLREAIKQILADYDKVDVNECPECHYAEKRAGAVWAYINVDVALKEQLATEPDVTLKEFCEYALSRPYLAGTEKLKTFCGVDMTRFIKLDTHSHSKTTIVNVQHVVSAWVDYTGKTHVKLSDGTTLNTTTPYSVIEEALMGEKEET